MSHILFFRKKILFKKLSLNIMVIENPTDQQRFYGMKLVTRKERYYEPLSVLPEVSCITNFVLNC
jgi:hypothetical protein